MILKTIESLEQNEYHHSWRAHAYVMSKSIPSSLPPDLVYLILRLVPTWSYLNLYDAREPLVDCEQRHSPWCSPDLDAPKAFGDY